MSYVRFAPSDIYILSVVNFNPSTRQFLIITYDPSFEPSAVPAAIGQ